MRTLALLGLAALASAATRDILDEEEFLHAKAFRDEALEVEREVARLNLEAGQGHAYVEPAPLSEGRHLALGLGLNLGPVGAGASAGLGWHGLGAGAGLGYTGTHNYASYGSQPHLATYYARSSSPQSYGAPATSPFHLAPSFPAARTVGLGLGANIGPVGAGASAGLANYGLYAGAGLGWGNYWQQYGAHPYHRPYLPQY